MATESAQRSPQESPPDQRTRRRPFSTWVKKLTNFKNSHNQPSSDDPSSSTPSNRYRGRRISRARDSRHERNGDINNPYPQALRIDDNPAHPRQSESTETISSGSITEGADDGNSPTTVGARSVAPTVCTDHEGTRSIRAPSGVTSLATSRTVGGGHDSSRRGGDSTFSSPAPSVRSLTTTLTTIQSMAPGITTTHAAPTNTNPPMQFHQPFPTTPASAVPAHLAPSSSTPGHPTTYTTATANNLLTDNASILTLASSSKRRRRRSLDTDASVRALAPSSLWGGSRESLPLSVLSASIDMPGGPGTPGLHQSSSSRMAGVGSASAERNSFYSTSAGPAAPALQSERNSFYARAASGAAAGAAGNGDGASMVGGLLGHGRTDSVNGSLIGLASPLASPREPSSRGDEAA